MTPLPERPFFIVGQPRSGTTLLRTILSSHPRLYVPGETGFLPFLDAPPNRPLQELEVAIMLAQIGRLNRNWDGLVADVGAFYRTLPQPPYAAHVLDALYRHQIGEKGARWGDKTPSYVGYIPAIDRFFPNAQFIHVVRDGRDTMLSARQKWGERPYVDAYYLLRRWVDNVTAGRQAGNGLGAGRYLEIHYEALVTTPRPELERLCEFLGEAFNPALLDHTRLARKEIGPGGHVEVRAPISTASVGRWRQEMTSFERTLAGRVAGPTLAAFGYERTETTPFTPAEWARFAWLAAKYRLTQAARALLYATGLLSLNRGKRNR